MPVAIAPGADSFDTDGVTPVEIQAAPPSTDVTFTILCIRYRNEDDVAHGYVLERVIGADRFVLARVEPGAIAPGGGDTPVTRDRIVIVDGITTSLEFSLTEATNTVEGDVSIELLQRTVS